MGNKEESGVEAMFWEAVILLNSSTGSGDLMASCPPFLCSDDVLPLIIENQDI